MFGLPPLPRTLAAAITDSKGERVHVRLSALKDLVRLTRSPAERGDALRALERVLAEDPSPELRREAAVGLADAEAVESCQPLLVSLGDADARVRQMAVLALGEVAAPGDAEVIARVRPLLAVADAPIRFQALIAFVRLAPEDAERVLAVASVDDDDEVRAMAYRLMDTRYQTEPAPSHLVTRATTALGDAASAVRAAAALFLAHGGERTADAVILGAIDGSVPTGTEADLLGAIDVVAVERLSAAIPGLARRAFGPLGLRSDSISWHALVALAVLGDERARRTILRGLSAWTRHSRTLSVVAVGRAGLVEARSAVQALRGNAARADQNAVEEALAMLDETSD